ncbi:MAG: (2Fe-2S)-binding protein [Crenarchaeota archaeon 13_1_40CM_3_53_5]|nr:MAG: (2Fe-2S)-binding protein [Crenarchaeota archaeon 13_1_40CM_3_53_5]
MALMTLRVNGEARDVSVQPHHSLLRVLREELGLLGSKRGCDTGGCGCCSVLVDDKVVYSCMVLAMSCVKKKIMTVEGLQVNGALDPLQEAFVRAGAIQCGYCIPGFIMASKDLMRRRRSPSEKEIAQSIAGNLCRCTGYQKIIEAIEMAVSNSNGAG